MRNSGLALLCLLVTAGILAAGLWPFTPYPRNDVVWTPDGWGLQFGDYGSILSAADAAAPVSPDGHCSLEIWLTPGLTDDSNVILAYARRDNPHQFRLGQDGDALYVGRQAFRNGSASEGPYIHIGHVFRQGRPVLLTVTAGERGTQVYLDGKRALTRLDFGLSASGLAGRMVVANSPVGNNTWSGVLQGIAVYGRELQAQEVAQHFAEWSAGDRTTLAQMGSDTLYLFREGAGSLVHNLGASSQPDLYIPDHYMILYPAFLHPFWKDSYLTVAAMKDIANNIVAFIPLGFLACAWLSGWRPGTRSLWFAILFGTLLSLTIEVLQYFIPMRDSDSLDWLMNIAGTALGAWLYILQARHDWLGRLPIAGRIWRVICPSNSRVVESVGSDLVA